MSPMMKLNAERLFRSKEFRLVSEGLIIRKFGVKTFPNRVFVTGGQGDKNRVMVLCAPHSRTGGHYGLSNEGLKFGLQKEDGDEFVQFYVAYCYGETDNWSLYELDGYITGQQQKRKLNGLTPLDGDYGPYFWVDKDGNPFIRGAITNMPWNEEDYRPIF